MVKWISVLMAALLKWIRHSLAMQAHGFAHRTLVQTMLVVPPEDLDHNCSRRPKAVHSIADPVREYRRDGHNIHLKGQTVHASWPRFCGS